MLSNGLRVAHGDFDFLFAVSKALGHMARRISNVDFVEFEVSQALEWRELKDQSEGKDHCKFRVIPLSSDVSLWTCCLSYFEGTGP